MHSRNVIACTRCISSSQPPGERQMLYRHWLRGDCGPSSARNRRIGRYSIQRKNPFKFYYVERWWFNVCLFFVQMKAIAFFQLHCKAQLKLHACKHAFIAVSKITGNKKYDSLTCMHQSVLAFLRLAAHTRPTMNEILALLVSGDAQ